ncbi:MAG: hypothetical protein LIO77_03085 [Rikenellaceae bacterium]|nr:hypothetical protein [Rikenellaceae bacterium]
MVSNIIVKVNRRELASIRSGEKTTVPLPRNPHWERKMRNPATGRYYPNMTVIVRSYEKEPEYVVSARAGDISCNESHYIIELKGAHILLPPFPHQLINEPRRNSIK